jgi:hypothetical protein
MGQNSPKIWNGFHSAGFSHGLDPLRNFGLDDKILPQADNDHSCSSVKRSNSSPKYLCKARESDEGSAEAIFRALFELNQSGLVQA